MTAVKVIGAEDFNYELLDSHRPFVVRGLVSDWPLVQASKQSNSACLDYLQSYYLGAPIVTFSGDGSAGNQFSYSDDLAELNFQKQSTTLDQLIEQLKLGLNKEQDVTHYMGSTTLGYVLPDLSNENNFEIPGVTPLQSAWIGNRTRVPAHYDVPDNLAFVCAGSRRFTLFPPEQLENLYIGPLDFTPAGQSISMVDINRPDYERFPRYKIAEKQALIAELKPGDAIYIPSLWWHHVESLDDVNVLINYWWRETPSYLGLPQDALLHSMLSVRDLPQHQKEHWQRIFNHYVFNSMEQSFEHIPSSQRGFLGKLDENLVRRLRALLISNLNR
jgi:hypothetical protein